MEQDQKHYYAFISYKREDKKEAKKLQHTLEYYRLPNKLRQENPELPEYVRPVFRDLTDLEVGELPEQIHKALNQSHFLIVVCSPRAAKSQWVNDEIEYFISLGKQEKIIPYIIEGVPHADDPDEECYPPALLSLSKEKELLGANINEVGKDSAAIRVVSRMFNIRFDTLYQRYRREKRKNRIIRYSTVAVFVLCLLSFLLYVLHANNRLREENYKTWVSQSKFIIEKANSLMDDGDMYLASRLLLSITPKGNSTNRPIMPELACALRKVEDYLSHEKESPVSTIGPGLGELERTDYGLKVSLCPKEDKVIIYGTYSNIIRVYSTINGKLLYSLKNPHSEGIYTCVYNTDGDILATASSKDGMAVLWDLNTGEELYRLESHENAIRDIVFSPDGKYIITTADAKCYLWNISGQLLDTITAKSRIVKTRLSRRSDYISLACIGRVQLVQIVDDKLQLVADFVHDERDWAVYMGSISDDSKYLATCSDDQEVKIWDIKTAKYLYTYSSSSGYLRDVAFLDDTRVLVSCCDGSVEIRNVVKNEREVYYTSAWIIHTSSGDAIIGREMENGTTIINYKLGNVQFLKDTNEQLHAIDVNYYTGKAVTVASDGKVRLYDLFDCLTEKSRVLTEVGGYYVYFNIHSLCQNKNGNLLLAAYRDSVASLIDYCSGENLLICKGHEQELYSANFNTHENHIVTTSYDGTARVWDVEQLKSPVVLHHEEPLYYAEFIDNDQKILSFCRSDIYVWNAHNGSLLQRLKGEEPPIKNDPADIFSEYIHDVSAVIFDSVRSCIWAAYRDGIIRIWDYNNEMVIKEIKAHQDPTSIKLTDDYLISFADEIKVWNANTGELISVLDGHDYTIGDLLILPNSPYLYSSSMDGKLLKWNYKTGELIKCIKEDNSCGIDNLSFKDGYLLAVSEDNHIYVFDVRDDSQICDYAVPEKIYGDVQFSNYDGNIIVPITSGKILLYDFSDIRQVVLDLKNRLGDYTLTPEERRKYYLE